MSVLTGLDCLRTEKFSGLHGAKIGLLCHPASVDSKLNHILDLMDDAGLDVSYVFGPEHGASGAVQDMETVAGGGHLAQHAKGTRCRRFVSLYGDNIDSLRPSYDIVKELDVMLVDLQDIGSRYYTFAVSMRYCMEVCAQVGVRVVVLDRPNPLGGLAIQGPVLNDEFYSFVGGFGVPIRHGLTIGELAMLATREGVDVDLKVISMRGWKRSMWFDQTRLPWVLPSPNMPTLATATVYPGLCLLEATNLSEGRGTTRPFELIGAPWLDSRSLARDMNETGLPGVRFRPVTFRPMFQKHEGRDCHGVQIHVLDRQIFEPIRTGVTLLDIAARQDPQQFAWRKEAYEFVTAPAALDLLAGSDELRLLIEHSDDTRDLFSKWRSESSRFQSQVGQYLLYS